LSLSKKRHWQTRDCRGEREEDRAGTEEKELQGERWVETKRIKDEGSDRDRDANAVETNQKKEKRQRTR
jgi:hypothetical protein